LLNEIEGRDQACFLCLCLIEEINHGQWLNILMQNIVETRDYVFIWKLFETLNGIDGRKQNSCLSGLEGILSHFDDIVLNI
jgi:hypothetical protein